MATSRKPPRERDSEYARQQIRRQIKSMSPGALGGRLASVRPTLHTGSPTEPAMYGGSSEAASSAVEFAHDAFTLASATPTVTLTYLPLDDSAHVYLNGLEQLEGTDYTLDQQSLEVLAAMDAEAGDLLDVRYAYQVDVPTQPSDSDEAEDDFAISDYGYATSNDFGDFRISGATATTDNGLKQALFTYEGSDVGKQWFAEIIMYTNTTYPSLATTPQQASSSSPETGPGSVLLQLETPTVNPVHTTKGMHYRIRETNAFGTIVACLGYGTDSALPTPAPLSCGSVAPTATYDSLFYVDLDYPAGWDSVTPTWYFEDGTSQVGPAQATGSGGSGTVTLMAPTVGDVAMVEIEGDPAVGAPSLVLRQYF